MRADVKQRSPGYDLVRFLTIYFLQFHHFVSLKFVKHDIDGRYLVGAKVVDNLTVGFYAVGRFPEVGDEIENIDFFHSDKVQ